MLFQEPRYAVFLGVVFLAYWALVALPRARLALLLAASCFFYMSWRPELIVLVAWSIVVDYLLALRIEAATRPAARRTWLVASLVSNLGLLAFFKYAGFLAGSAHSLLALAGVQVPAPVLDVILPVGISFYTFQSLSYTIDVYRGVIPASRSLPGFAVYVLFFPQLVAGPIVRASDFLPQLEEEPFLLQRQGSEALARIARGLVKKLLLADVLAVHLVDAPFASPDPFSSLECLIAVYAYAFQIYLDFSAYSDIAIGSARLLGFRLPENFDAPYRAASLTEFWRRWHMTLSTWLRDYLYVPLGGNRRGRLRTHVNLMITMLLGGLWHGAAWNFVAWGGLHGAGLAVERALGVRAGEATGVRRVVRTLVTFHLVCLAWVFFRAPGFEGAFALLERIADLDGGTANLAPLPLLALLAAAISHGVPAAAVRRLTEGFGALPVPARALVLAGVALGLKQISATEATPFIYFQF